jgi:hypothetical protein
MILGNRSPLVWTSKRSPGTGMGSGSLRGAGEWVSPACPSALNLLDRNGHDRRQQQQAEAKNAEFHYEFLHGFDSGGAVNA